MRASWPRTRIEYTVTLEHTVIILYYLKATTALRKLRSFALLAKTFCPLGGEDPAMRESPILLCVCVCARVCVQCLFHTYKMPSSLSNRDIMWPSGALKAATWARGREMEREGE